jgi:BMFP domain-containing protein YqiC
MADDVERYPWDRLPGETSKAYEAFRAFRDLGPRRRIIDAPTASIRQARLWARLHSWTARAVAWDDETGRLEDADRLEALRSMHSNHARAARAVQQYALAALSRLDVADASPSDVARLLELGARLERLTLTQSVEELQGRPASITDGDDPWARIARELADTPTA